MKTKNDTTGSIYAQTTTGTKQKFDSNIAGITDPRFAVIIKTNQKLTDIAEVLSSYIVETNTSIINEKISQSLNFVNAHISKLNSMIAEFKTKSTSSFYNQTTGLNDMFVESSAYLCDYSKFLILLNDYLKDIDKTVDVKFAMMNLYCKIAESTFSNIAEVDGLKNLKSSTNIDKINENFQLINSNLVVTDSFSADNNLFIKNYNSCNQTVFASSLAETLNSVSAYSDDLSYEAKAAYYFKKIYNIG